MKLQESIPLSDIYKREEDFSADLAKTLDVLNIGKFEDPETESNVGTRKADIVAVGEDGGKLVVENQFGKANWDHWGRLEAYARLKDAKVAVLVAENFEDLMIATCNLRNEDSKVDWYLIRAQANTHKELSFHHVVSPAIDIQVESTAGAEYSSEYSEFWEPIRREGLFQGKSVHDSWFTKIVNGIRLVPELRNHRCQIRMSFRGENRSERRAEIMEFFPESEYNYEYRESRSYASVIFPVLDKGIKDRDDWDEMREKLISMGTDIYNKINESDT